MGVGDVSILPESDSFEQDSHVIMSEYLLIFSLLLGVCLMLQYFVKNVWKSKYLPDSGATLLLGIFIGFIY